MNSFGTQATLRVGEREYEIFRLAALEKSGFTVSRLPFSLRVLLESLLRHEDGQVVTPDDITALACWDPAKPCSREIAFTPARVLLQDFTGVPAVVDLAAMRDAMAAMGGEPSRINPLQPVELVIDHSVQVDAFGSADAMQLNVDLEFHRNRERYNFLRWGGQAFQNFSAVPPGKGIVHQVNLEYLARVVFSSDENQAATREGLPRAYPDTVVGTDSHTTMVNGLGVLGWGVGGIEAEAAMLGEAMSMLIPEVVGFRLEGTLPEGATATDLVLTVTEMLRKKGVVGKFVEFYGPGLASLSVADRATIANMAPEYGATCGIFPVDAETLRYLRFTGRSEAHVALVEAYMKEQGLFNTPESPAAVYSDTLSLDLASVEPSIAGPRRPQDRVPLSQAEAAFHQALPSMLRTPVAATAAQAEGFPDYAKDPSAVTVRLADAESVLHHGSIVIAAITSCTNTSNPSVMIAAGLLAKKAAERGLKARPWVKTSLAPGSRVVTEYLNEAGLTPCLEAVGFYTVGYGCTTCIGNSGPLPPPISEGIEKGGLVVASVLSGNRNFEGRIQSEVRANYLMSPPLVVAYALAGRMDIDLVKEPLGLDKEGDPVYLREIWPTSEEVQETLEGAVRSEMFQKSYSTVFQGTEGWNALVVPEGDRFTWDPNSTYVRRAPYFDQMPREAPATVAEIRGARVLAWLGDSVTTDHISPAGSIRKDSPAGQYLIERGVSPLDFNSYGARRGNHEVMVRGTFANVRLRNRLAPGTEGGFTTYLPTGEVTTIYDAAMQYQTAGIPLLVLAGKEYGSGSSRDWAAKGPRLLGVRAVIAESYERIHRSNLVGMGVLPLQFGPGETAESLGLTGAETFDIQGVAEGIATNFSAGRQVTVCARRADGTELRFSATVRIDTAQEVLYYRHGGILQFVLRKLLEV
jgi:aconitate hydratase